VINDGLPEIPELPETALIAAQFSDELRMLGEAKSCSNWDHWREAMDEEIAQLEGLGTYRKEDIPEGRTAVACKWVYRIKYDEKGNVARYMARLITKGFSQIPGIDFDQTFAPMMRSESLRALIALATQLNLCIHTVDAVGAYLNGELEETIYMQQPPGYEDGTGRALRLLKTLYGLKQSG
jgi:hypothetical protein